MTWSTQRLYFASVGAVGLATLVGVYALATPHYVYFIGALGIVHAAVASAGAKATGFRFLVLETALASLAVGAVWLHTLRVLPGASGVGEALRRILVADLLSRAGVGSLFAYVLSWGALIGILSCGIAFLFRDSHGSLPDRWLRSALGLAATNVLFRFALYNPITEVGVWQPKGSEALVGAMALGALIEPLVLFLLTLATTAGHRWLTVAPKSVRGL